MAEAVGTLSEARSGLEPLTRLQPPKANAVTAATAANVVKEPTPAWAVTLPDRAVALKATGPGALSVLTWDGSLLQLDGAGKVVKQEAVKPADVAKLTQDLQAKPDPGAVQAAQKNAPAGRVVKFVAAQDGLTAVGFWGGGLRVLGAKGDVVEAQQLPQDLTGLAWLDGKLVAGLADGQVVALTVK
jgi:hypothetical protein